MTTQERYDDIIENLLLMSNNPRVSRLCVYYDPHCENKKVYFGTTAKTQEALEAEIMKYAEEHPVE